MKAVRKTSGGDEAPLPSPGSFGPAVGGFFLPADGKKEEPAAVGDIWLAATGGPGREDALTSVVIVEERKSGEYACMALARDAEGVREGEALLDPDDAEAGETEGFKAVPHRSLTLCETELKAKTGRLNARGLSKILKADIFYRTERYFRAIHEPAQKAGFVPGSSRVNYAGRVFDETELVSLVDSSLDFWLTAGTYTERFEREFAAYLGLPYCSLVNSGSSANMVAVAALASPLLGERRIRRGDEIITTAAAFPTTVAPILQIGAVPVFVDIGIPSYNIDVTRLEAALSGKTKALVAAHGLGNVFNLGAVADFCKAHGLWLIEDNCDALGGEYTIDGLARKTGTIGDIGTSSFYPAHHITTGEGGAVYTRDPLLHRIIRSLRDWGRDCVCTGGQDNKCGRRFEGQYGALPRGYDHKYVYSHLGYNLKSTDLQAAIGCAQLKKLPMFIRKRRENWDFLREHLSPLEDVFILPEKEKGSNPSWFGFILAVRDACRKGRDEIVAFIESQNVQTRSFFAGNILRHPCFSDLAEGRDYRAASGLANTDFAMNKAFWVGVYPGMTRRMLDFMVQTITRSVRD